MDTATVGRFEANRDRLASIAYRLLGSAADAEDVVQESFIRWQAADRTHIKVPEAWLTKVVSNLSVDRLRSAKERHERAVGAWLPEPLLDGDPMLGPADTAVQRESVTLAMLTLMERLSPMERAVYVLREAFSHSHGEVAEILDITESASQQHALRARRHLASERTATEVDADSARRIVEAFVAASASGRTEPLVSLLADDVTAVSDGAGLSAKLLHFAGAKKVSAMLRAGFKPTRAKHELLGGTPSVFAGTVNGSPAMIVGFEDRVVGVVVLDVVGDEITTVRGMASQARLHRVSEEWRRRDHGPPIIESW
ncbi:sigma-70 family RNA polymerase sigma factor [Rhodococcus sp. NPDC058521]|uniref:sigma-70 family RNA polymerase sigma factor n=1 Tax=Rhodococcus sp. NPDC058521 TaxID=3346536 RepID=UPI003667DB1C